MNSIGTIKYFNKKNEDYIREYLNKKLGSNIEALWKIQFFGIHYSFFLKKIGLFKRKTLYLKLRS